MSHANDSIIMHSIQELEQLLPLRCSLFFIGIGGVSMSALAMIAREKGYTVSGSDRAVSRFTEMLREAGIPVFGRHDAENIDGCDAVIYNAAIGDDNPELARAKKEGIPVIYRTAFLTYLMRGYRRAIGIAGMHGKSTTSAMLSHLFLFARRDPAILIGAPIAALGRDFHCGTGEDFIFEACEYKDSFLSFRPTITVVLNEEMDHPDYFRSLDQVRESFFRYMQIPGEDGVNIVNLDDDNVMKSAEHTAARKVTFSTARRDADFYAENITYRGGRPSFDVLYGGAPFCHIDLSVPGTHNVSNALACCAAAVLSGIGPDVIAAGLSSFSGAARRMEYTGQLRGCPYPVDVYDDFGHHPSEIVTTLDGARRMTEKRLICVYQPHTYSRTFELFDDFCKSFDLCDAVYFTDIYAAREQNVYGVSSSQLADHIPHAVYLPDLDALRARLLETVAAGDTVVVMGAGDIAAFADRLVSAP